MLIRCVRQMSLLAWLMPRLLSSALVCNASGSLCAQVQGRQTGLVVLCCMKGLWLAPPLGLEMWPKCSSQHRGSEALQADQRLVGGGRK